MNIENLSQEEIKSLHTLLGKMLEQPKPKVYIDPVGKMVNEIIEGFDFDKVHKTMVELNWTWAESFMPPSIEEMKDTAEYLLREAAKSRLSDDYMEIHHSSPITVGTGGFEAKAWCDEYHQITELELKFVVASYDASLE
jgi:hypothetical protein